MEELFDFEFEIPDDNYAPDSHHQGMETFLMTSEEFERSASPRTRRRREED